MSETPTTRPAKVGLVEMILLAEQEAERIDTWETVLHREGSELDPGVARRRLISRKTVEVLELVLKFEDEIVQMVKMRNEAEKRERRSKEPDAA